jgi:Uma2 family endonuclease
MAAPRPNPYLTVDQYLTFERASEDRHIYLDGAIFAMAGESDAHGVISVNIVGSLHAQLKGTPRQVRTKDTKVRTGPAAATGSGTRGLFSYPDVLVICGQLEFHDEFTDVVLNPTAIIEVLSPATEAFDRGEKFTRYQSYNPALQEYVLVSQDRPQVELFTRQAGGNWSYHRAAGLEATVLLSSIRCTLKLADIYDRLQFPPES